PPGLAADGIVYCDRAAMAKPGIKIKDLARELGVTSRQLIDRCRENGVKAQNSLTKLPPQTERTVRSWFVRHSNGDVGGDTAGPR
ncbi:MAG: hypothetical protein JSU63_07265, partial [Phycisphaerales bacterium]